MYVNYMRVQGSLLREQPFFIAWGEGWRIFGITWFSEETEGGESLPAEYKEGDVEN